MKIKKGDKVKIIAGKDKGKTGKVLQVFISRSRASIEGLNLLIKHMRPRRQGEQGQRIEFPAPMNISNMMLMCPRCGKAARVGYKIVKVDPKKSQVSSGPEAGKEKKKTKNKKYRVCQKCKQTID
ncbi:50S ribosomal protein L24 [Candidatus Falkowbacteria bacterium]|nr:MAG: 50S ribosomal protein L24 [Candidatus Falkowbacteria bacterium]